ncbi:MAG: hypothetical protein AMXMBFR80_12990 [Dehalococcoidia bacterium]
MEQARPDRDQWIVKLSGLTTRTMAEGFHGELIEAADGDVLRDDAESFFVHELIGLRAVTEDGRQLGAVAEVIQTGANDVYVAVGEGGEVLIPAIGDVVRQIDLSAGLMVITPLPGMLDESR